MLYYVSYCTRCYVEGLLGVLTVLSVLAVLAILGGEPISFICVQHNHNQFKKLISKKNKKQISWCRNHCFTYPHWKYSPCHDFLYLPGIRRVKIARLWISHSQSCYFIKLLRSNHVCVIVWYYHNIWYNHRIYKNDIVIICAFFRTHQIGTSFGVWVSCRSGDQLSFFFIVNVSRRWAWT